MWFSHRRSSKSASQQFHLYKKSKSNSFLCLILYNKSYDLMSNLNLEWSQLWFDIHIVDMRLKMTKLWFSPTQVSMLSTLSMLSMMSLVSMMSSMQIMSIMLIHSIMMLMQIIIIIIISIDNDISDVNNVSNFTISNIFIIPMSKNVIKLENTATESQRIFSISYVTSATPYGQSIQHRRLFHGSIDR